MWVKICANTNLEDALLAADLGADAVGFVFAPSKRQVTAAQVAAITAHLPAHVERVGVFQGSTSAEVEEIAQAVELAGLTAVQMHGGLNLPFARALARRLGPAVRLIHTAHWKLDEDDASASRVAAQLAELEAEEGLSRILVDAKVGDASGGLGVPFNWARAARVLRTGPNLELIIAGGLTPENVTEAITRLKPFGVDVASGVELSAGKKDPERLQSFLRAARGAV
jgi:phosphoribosylanthranilate isomerase